MVLSGLRQRRIDALNTRYSGQREAGSTRLGVRNTVATAGILALGLLPLARAGQHF